MMLQLIFMLMLMMTSPSDKTFICYFIYWLLIISQLYTGDQHYITRALLKLSILFKTH